MKNTIIKTMFTCMAALAMVFLFGVAAKAADINITFPTDRAIFQRNAYDKADVTVKATYTGDGVVKATIDDGQNWTELEDDGSGNYEGTIYDVWSGGWYVLEVVAFDGDDVITSTQLDHIGIGEVFITGGQSNSCNFGGSKTTAENDIVSAFDAANNRWQHCADAQPDTSGFATGNAGGSPWPTLGDELVERLDVPIGFVTTGYGGARIDELETTRYNAIRQAITLLKPYGYRAFLIHQGEADEGTDRTVYAENYKRLIEKTRDEAGYDLVWIVAQVSYAWSNYNNPTRAASITAAQRSICNNYDIFVGPTTDDLLGDYRHTDNLHLSLKGLIEHGKRWADVIVDKLFTKYPVYQADDVENGRVEFEDPEGYPGNAMVSPQFIPDDGYYYVEGSIRATGEEDRELPVYGDSFTMAAEEVSVYGTFEKLPDHILAVGNAIKAEEGADYSSYTDESVAALMAAIEDAKAVYANPKATEEETKAATEKIEQCKKGLVKKPAVVDPNANGGNQVDNSGNNASNADAVKTGDIAKAGALSYKVLSNNTVEVYKLNKKNAKSVTIPKTIKIKGSTYKVVSIAKGAFASAKKLKTITIKATTIKSVGKKAFSGTSKKLKIKVPAKKLSAYKKLFKGKGLAKTAKITK